jgi:hypothetical protein
VDPDGVKYVIDPAWAGVPIDAARSTAKAMPAMMTLPLFEQFLMLVFSCGVARAVYPRDHHTGTPIGVAPALPILLAPSSSRARFERA